jgi:hypothetical protein
MNPLPSSIQQKTNQETKTIASFQGEKKRERERERERETKTIEGTREDITYHQI